MHMYYPPILPTYLLITNTVLGQCLKFLLRAKMILIRAYLEDIIMEQNS